MEAKIKRQQALVGVRRAMVLAATRELFTQVGVDKVSIREIAKRAGYTPGAIYAYFSGKKELLGALLEESLQQLEDSVSAVKSGKAKGDKLPQARASAWFAYFVAHPHELDLVLLLLRPRKTPNGKAAFGATVPARLRQSLTSCGEALQAMGVDPAVVRPEMDALMAHGMGLLMVHHSAPLPPPARSAQDLFDDYVQQMVLRVLPDAGVDSAHKGQAATTAQVDLFA